MRVCSLLLLWLLADCTAQNGDTCDLGDPAGLSSCIKRLLADARPKVAEKADPLRLPDHKDGDLSASNIVIRGIADYSVEALTVTFPGSQQIAVRATIAWPRLRADLDATLKKCKRILFKRRCFRLRARPDVTVGRTAGTLTTTLAVQVAAGGQLTVRASDTKVTLSLARPRVKANLRGFVGFLNRIFFDPASRISTKLANKWWRKNKSKIQTKASNALDKIVRDELSVHLGRLLKV